MNTLKVHQGDSTTLIEIEQGTTLLAALRDNGFQITAPCGGAGSCGKCKVTLKHIGQVSSCLYPIESDLEVLMPNNTEMKVMEAQSTFTKNVFFNPMELSELSPYPFGVAIDIGTTTVVMYFISLVSGTLLQTKSFVNPQSVYGADVVSRIDYTSKSSSNLAQLRVAIVKAIDKELDVFIKGQQISENEIVKINIAGNTTMLHFLAGVDAISIAQAPYTPQFTELKTLKGQDVFKHVNKDAAIHLLPSISAFVGADIVAGLASLEPGEDIKNYIFVDIGTNGEMALVTGNDIVCCSTAAGPAFEGANISCGMGAFSGAISEVQKGKLSTINNEKAKGICGSGLIDAVAYLLDAGNISMEGEMEKPFSFSEVDESLAEQIALQPADIREVQLAKSAIYSGIKMMLSHRNIDFDSIDALFLAGGFGSYINTDSAIRIGLLPQEMKGKIYSIGNASGTGALLTCKSNDFMQQVQAVKDKAEYLELATHPDFAMEYAMNMYFV